jgi:phosphatidylserine/phosphatidylglycerophosphate/cardiolipin synthase-like enzyme
LLKNRVKEGLDVRVIGKVGKRASDLSHEKYPGKRLHVRVIIRDGREAFVGSQSLRKLELEKRREVGCIFRDASAVAELTKTFEDDWALTESGKQSKEKDKSEADDAKSQREARAEA